MMVKINYVVLPAGIKIDCASKMVFNVLETLLFLSTRC